MAKSRRMFVSACLRCVLQCTPSLVRLRTSLEGALTDMRIVLMRHCETTKNLGNRFDSTSMSESLTGDGSSQLSATLSFISRVLPPQEPSAVVTGPRSRTNLTARPLADALGLDCHIETQLLPMDPGLLAGLTELEARQKFGPLMERRACFRECKVDGYSIQFPEGDNVKDYESRVKSVLDEVIEQYRHHHSVYVVTHQSVILSALNVFRKMFAGQPSDVDFCYYETPKGCIDEIRLSSPTSGRIVRYGGCEDWSH